jgi:hypothetical protein
MGKFLYYMHLYHLMSMYLRSNRTPCQACYIASPIATGCGTAGLLSATMQCFPVQAKPNHHGLGRLDHTLAQFCVHRTFDADRRQWSVYAQARGQNKHATETSKRRARSFQGVVSRPSTSCNMRSEVAVLDRETSKRAAFFCSRNF